MYLLWTALVSGIKIDFQTCIYDRLKCRHRPKTKEMRRCHYPVDHTANGPHTVSVTHVESFESDMNGLLSSF